MTTIPPHSVQFTPPPAALATQLERRIAAKLQLKPNQKAALLLVGHVQDGQQKFNAVFAMRAGRGWEIDFAIAKDWGQRLGGGIQVLKTWE